MACYGQLLVSMNRPVAAVLIDDVATSGVVAVDHDHAMAVVWPCAMTVEDYVSAGRSVPMPVVDCPCCRTRLRPDGEGFRAYPCGPAPRSRSTACRSPTCSTGSHAGQRPSRARGRYRRCSGCQCQRWWASRWTHLSPRHRPVAGASLHHGHEVGDHLFHDVCGFHRPTATASGVNGSNGTESESIDAAAFGAW